ncbi:MAG: MaoC family dehydratase [bacterium]|nr:MaoC family dehydratase [bacterium]
MKAVAAPLRYGDIVVGDVYEFTRTITPEDVMAFARLTGDCNPLHMDAAFGRQSAFGSTVVHGMLSASLCSTLIGMHCPGRDALYLGQTLQFRKPILPGETVIVRGTVIAKSDALRVVTVRTEVVRGDDVCITGEATARVLE